MAIEWKAWLFPHARGYKKERGCNDCFSWVVHEVIKKKGGATTVSLEWWAADRLNHRNGRNWAKSKEKRYSTEATTSLSDDATDRLETFSVVKTTVNVTKISNEIKNKWFWSKEKEQVVPGSRPTTNDQLTEEVSNRRKFWPQKPFRLLPWDIKRKDQGMRSKFSGTND